LRGGELRGESGCKEGRYGEQAVAAGGTHEGCYHVVSASLWAGFRL
jgi:hypothetical protein